MRNLLVMTGDYTYTGYQGRSKPVFDLDPTMLLHMITDLNKGLEVPVFKGTTKLAPTHFFAGAVVSPFKAVESEQMGQYYKLKKKLEAGAQFIVTQLGYDARKFQEALLMVKHLGFGHVPVIGNVYLLPLGAAKLMNRNGLPGCVVTNELVAAIEKEVRQAEDKGKAKRLERAAKMYAFMKGMGFAGVHIGGHGMKYEDVEVRSSSRARNWCPTGTTSCAEFEFPQPNGWYYFEQDGKTGLNTETPVDRAADRPAAPLGYKAFKVLHNAMFEKEGFLFKPMQSLAKAVDGSILEHAFTRVEHLMKVITNECMHCGDCGLFDVAYLCPTSQCPKGQRNGPCGGSFEGWCEVYPKEKQCIYVRAYPRLKSHGAEDTLGCLPRGPGQLRPAVDLLVAELLPGTRPHGEAPGHPAPGQEVAEFGRNGRRRRRGGPGASPLPFERARAKREWAGPPSFSWNPCTGATSAAWLGPWRTSGSTTSSSSTRRPRPSRTRPSSAWRGARPTWSGAPGWCTASTRR